MSYQRFGSFLSLCVLTGALSLYGSEISKDSLPPNPPLPTLLDGRTQPKFVNQLPSLVSPHYIFKPHHTRKNVDFYSIERVRFFADLGIRNDQNQSVRTAMFGYASKNQPATFPGRTIVVNKNQTIKVLWKNKLLYTHTRLPLPQLHYVPVDNTIHMAMPMHPEYPTSGVPTVAHLHGGFTLPDSDGYPDAWTTPNFAQVGSFFKNRIFTYDNKQEPTLLWYHDHALGFTRLNNYAGLEGAYVIRGAPEKQLIQKNQIPSGNYEMPLFIVDKMFTTEGRMFFPYFDPSNPNQPQPSVIPEFFGDFMLVNGKAWPHANIEPRSYRLRLLNACDSRFLDLHFVQDSDPTNDISFYQIGTDQGLLNKPVKISHLLIAPGQRADLVVDFSTYKHKIIILTNTAKTPYPNGNPVDPQSTGIVMSFKVNQSLTKEVPQSKLPHKLRTHSIKRLHPTAQPRQVLLFATVDEYSRKMPMLGTPALGALHWDAPVTETPLLGSTEIWEIYNTTADAHPIHLHSGNFQILDRQYFSGTLDPITGVLTNSTMLGTPIAPLPAEKGLFDTAIVYPASEGPVEAIGQRTRIIMKFTIPGNFVWHCHILSHEDHDMMRPMFVRKK